MALLKHAFAPAALIESVDCDSAAGEDAEERVVEADVLGEAVDESEAGFDGSRGGGVGGFGVELVAVWEAKPAFFDGDF